MPHYHDDTKALTTLRISQLSFAPHNSFDPVLSLLCTFVSTPLYPSLVSPYLAHPRWLCLGSVRRLSYRQDCKLPDAMEYKDATCAEDGAEFIPGHDACGHTTSFMHLSLTPCSIREMTFAHWDVGTPYPPLHPMPYVIPSVTRVASF